MAEPIQTALSLTDFVKLVLASGLSSAILNQVIQVVRERKKHSNSSKYAAIRVIARLDQFVYESIEHLRAFNSSYERCVDKQDWNDLKQVAYPKLEIAEGDFELIPPEVMARIAWLETEILFAESQITKNWMFDSDFEEVITQQAQVLAYVGHEAALLSKRLRDSHDSIAHVSYEYIEKSINELKGMAEQGSVLLHG